MFFREKISQKSKNPTLQLVENYRDGDKVRQNVVVSLGIGFEIVKVQRIPLPLKPKQIPKMIPVQPKEVLSVSTQEIIDSISVDSIALFSSILASIVRSLSQRISFCLNLVNNFSSLTKSK